MVESPVHWLNYILNMGINNDKHPQHPTFWGEQPGESPALWPKKISIRLSDINIYIYVMSNQMVKMLIVAPQKIKVGQIRLKLWEH